MEPEVREGLAGHGFRLRDLVFVMRENQIFSAGVKVEGLTEFTHRHDRALQMPAWAAGADRRFPGCLVRLGGLPESEIAGAVFVVFVDVNASAILHAAEISFRKFPILWKLGDAEVIRAVVGAVR